MNPQPEQVLNKFEQALLSRDRANVRGILQELHTKELPIVVIDTLVTPVLERIGNAWEGGSIALSQVYMSGKLCQDVVLNLFSDEVVHREDSPRIALVVLQDYHILGKSIVHSVLRSIGYDVLDYGHGIDVDTLVQRAADDDVDILLISALMLPSAFLIGDVCKQLKARKPDIKIVVGGAPFRFDDQLWIQVGADGMGRTASDAIGMVAKFSGLL